MYFCTVLGDALSGLWDDNILGLDGKGTHRPRDGEQYWGLDVICGNRGFDPVAWVGCLSGEAGGLGGVVIFRADWWWDFDWGSAAELGVDLGSAWGVDLTVLLIWQRC